jgi:uncharacterized protein DUF2779
MATADYSTTSFCPQIRSDPRRGFITSLCAVIGKGGSVVVYYQTFEEQRLTELAAWLPEFAGRINIQSRLWDLLPVMRKHVVVDRKHPGPRKKSSKTLCEKESYENGLQNDDRSH